MKLAAVKLVFTSLAVAFLLYFGWESRALLGDILSSARPLPLVAAVLAWVFMHVLSPLFSTLIFRARGYPLSFPTAARIHTENLPARYLPGGIWHTVGRIAGFRALGIGKQDIAVFVFLENALAVAVAFLIGGSLLTWFHGMNGWGRIAAFAAVGALALLLLSPLILRFRVLKSTGSFPAGQFVTSALLVAISWCVGATAFVMYLSAFPGLALQSSALETGAAYLFSWGVGFISVFAPQGIGVFEIVAADLVRGSGSLAGFAALLAGFRLVIGIADALAWCGGHFLPRSNSKDL